jgi:hypothetical protein
MPWNNQGMETSTSPLDPLDLLRSLHADQLAKRLDELVAESKALRVLLRSARAREAARRRQQKQKETSDAHS